MELFDTNSSHTDCCLACRIQDYGPLNVITENGLILLQYIPHSYYTLTGLIGGAIVAHKSSYDSFFHGISAHIFMIVFVPSSLYQSINLTVTTLIPVHGLCQQSDQNSTCFL